MEEKNIGKRGKGEKEKRRKDPNSQMYVVVRFQFDI